MLQINFECPYCRAYNSTEKLKFAPADLDITYQHYCCVCGQKTAFTVPKKAIAVRDKIQPPLEPPFEHSMLNLWTILFDKGLKVKRIVTGWPRIRKIIDGREQVYVSDFGIAQFIFDPSLLKDEYRLEVGE